MKRTLPAVLLLVLAAGCGGSSSDGKASSTAPTADQEKAPKVSGQIIKSGFGQRDEYVQYVAVVKNATDHGGQTVTVTANFYDAADELVKTESQVESFSWGGQELVVPVFAELDNVRVKVARVESSLEVEEDGIGHEGDPLPDVDAQTIAKDYGGWKAKFKVTNATDASLEDLRMGIVCTNAAGDIIGGDSAFPDTIAAGGEALVESSPITAGKPAACTASVNYF